MKNQKGSAVVWIIIIVAVFVIAGGIYFYSKNTFVLVPTVTAPQTTSSTPTENLSITSISPSIASAGQTITVNGSGFSKTNPNNEEGMSWGKQNPTAIALTNSQGKTVQLSVASVPSDNSLTFLVPFLPVCIGVERGCGSSDPASYFLNINPGIYSVAVEDGVTGVKSNAVSLTVTDSYKVDIYGAVPGMTDYTDSNLGFMFWYPSSWQVMQVPVQNPNEYSGGTIVKQFVVSVPNKTPFNPGVMISEYSSSARTITDSGQCGAMGNCSTTTRYYFDTGTHTWMVEYSGATKAADISANTMGGLHMLSAGTDTIIPLSAENFLVVSNDQSESVAVTDSQNYLANTIVATDPSVGTPLSAVQIIQTIQAEAKAYGVSGQ